MKGAGGFSSFLKDTGPPQVYARCTPSCTPTRGLREGLSVLHLREKELAEDFIREHVDRPLDEAGQNHSREHGRRTPELRRVRQDDGVDSEPLFFRQKNIRQKLPKARPLEQEERSRVRELEAVDLDAVVDHVLGLTALTNENTAEVAHRLGPPNPMELDQVSGILVKPLGLIGSGPGGAVVTCIL